MQRCPSSRPPGYIQHLRDEDAQRQRALELVVGVDVAVPVAAHVPVGPAVFVPPLALCQLVVVEEDLVLPVEEAPLVVSLPQPARVTVLRQRLAAVVCAGWQRGEQRRHGGQG